MQVPITSFFRFFHLSGVCDTIWMIRLASALKIEDFCIAVSQGPALSQSQVFNFQGMECGTLLIKDEVIFVIELDCCREFVLEMMYKEVEEEGGLA